MRDDGKPVLVTELGLSTRVTHLLQRNGIHSVAILERMGDESLMLLRGMGPGMFAEIRSKVPRPKVSDTEELAAYRATGLTPEEIKNALDVNDIIPEINVTVDHIRDLLKAEQDGRLVVLPCKVGDTVYFRTYTKNGTVCLGIQPHEVVEIKGFAVVRGEHTDIGINANSFGTNVFMTREAAEAALEGGDA